SQASSAMEEVVKSAAWTKGRAAQREELCQSAKMPTVLVSALVDRPCLAAPELVTKTVAALVRTAARPVGPAEAAVVSLNASGARAPNAPSMAGLAAPRARGFRAASKVCNASSP